MRDVYFYYGTGGNIHCRNGSREATKELANGDSRDKAIYVHGRIPCAFVRLRRPKAAFRDLLMTFDRLCRYSLSLAFCAENAALALRAPSMPHDHAAGGGRGVDPYALTRVPPTVKVIL